MTRYEDMNSAQTMLVFIEEQKSRKNSSKVSNNPVVVDNVGDWAS